MTQHTYTHTQLRNVHDRLAVGDTVLIVGQPWTIERDAMGWKIVQGYRPHRYIHSKPTVLDMITAIEEYADAMADKAAADAVVRRP